MVNIYGGFVLGVYSLTLRPEPYPKPEPYDSGQCFDAVLGKT